MFRTVVAVALLLLAGGAVAEVRLPLIAEAADRYRAEIEAAPREGDAARLLALIREAEGRGDAAELVRHYASIVALNPDNIRAWLQLGSAWRRVDPRAEKALAAGYNAYRVSASSAPRQLDALLLISAVLRARLQEARKEYEDGQAQADSARRLLALITDPTQDEYDRELPDSPTGKVRTLELSRDEGGRRADEALGRLAGLAASLDEVYREVAAVVPGASVDRLQVQDRRSSVFAPVSAILSKNREETREVKIDYRLGGGDIRACLAFTQDLRPAGLDYKTFVKVKEGEQDATFGIEIRDSTLCLTGLAPGGSYDLTLEKGLPSRAGTALEAPVTQGLKLPDLPARISFAGRRFILPTGGPGEIPLRVTNLDEFELDLFRISDRTLYRHVALGHVGGEMAYAEFADLKDKFGERIWSGHVSLAADFAKPNVPTRLGLPVRSLLQQRREWLDREIRDARGGLGATASASLPLANLSDDKVGVTGTFFAGATPFEAETRGIASPGVYALVTAAPKKANDGDDGGAPDRDPTCTDKPTRDGRNTCDRFMVQWFLETDLGLSFYEGDTGFTVIARSFRTGQAKPGTTVELVSGANRVIASAPTDALGVASFPINLTRGSGANRLVAILAHEREDFGFIPFAPERLDLSRLNLDGRAVTQGLGAFLATERGLYQPGEAVNVTALLRDGEGRAAASAPQTVMRLESRDLVLKQVHLKPEDWRLGGTAIKLDLPDTMRPGQARITLALGEGESAPILGEMQVQVGPVRPDRARLDFLPQDVPWARISAAGAVTVKGAVTAQALYGARGTTQGRLGNARAEVLLKVGAAEAPRSGCFQAFTFGRFDEKVAPTSTRSMFLADQDGRLEMSIASAAPDIRRPLAATVEVTFFDTAGPMASRSRSFPVEEDTDWIGISNVPRLSPGGTPGTVNLAVDLAWSRGGSGAVEYRLERERDSYTWELQKGAWLSRRNGERERVGGGRIEAADLARTLSTATGDEQRPCPDTLTTGALGRDLEMGRYVLTVTDLGTRRESAVRLNVGAASTEADQLEPNIFVLATDKATYRPGEEVTITAEIPFESGEVLIAFADGDVRHWVQARAQNRRATIRVPVRPEWVGHGLYALATAYRAGADGSAATGPARAIGAAHFDVRGEETGFSVDLRLVGSAGQRVPLTRQAIEADEALTVELCIATPAGCSPNPPSEAYATLYVVDEGLLGLTGQSESPPDPERQFHSRKRFGLRIMDNYDRLLLKEGGDRPTRLALSNYTSSRIVSHAFGPLKLDRGRASVTIPRVGLRNGTLVVTAIAWTGSYATARAAAVQVRGPVVADLDVPAFLLSGDRAILPLRLQNVALSDVDLSVRVAGTGVVRGVAISADPGRLQQAAAELPVTLRYGEPLRTVYVAVDTAGPGEGTISVVLNAPASPLPLPGGRQEWTIAVRDADLSSVETVSFPLARQSRNLARLAEGIVADGFRPESVKVSASFAAEPLRLLAATAAGPADGSDSRVLDHLVWRGLRRLYASGRGPVKDDPEVLRVIGEIQSLQLANGSYAPYRSAGDFAPGEISLSPGGDPQKPDGPESLLRAVSAFDFLSLARKAGYEVADRGLRAARIFIAARTKTRPDLCGFEAAYALLALVSHSPGAVEQDQIEALAKCSGDDLLARSAAAAAAAGFGLPDQAMTLLAGFEDKQDPPNVADLDDYRGALVLSFLRQAGAAPAAVDTVAEALLRLDKRATLSRAAAAYILRGAAEAPPASAPVQPTAAILVEGAPQGFIRTRDGVVEIAAMTLAQLRPVTVAASAGDRARGRLVVEGFLARPAEASLLPRDALRRRYFDLETGEERNLAGKPLRLGDRIVIVVEGGRAAVEKAGPAASDGDGGGADTGPLLVGDLLPSAFEIIAGDLFRSTAFSLTGPLAKLPPLGDLRSVEVRPDRWVALIVPESKRNGAGPDEKAGAPEVEERPPRPRSAGSGRPAAPGSAGTPAPNRNQVEFRQAYLVRVGMAGRFVSPGLLLEASLPPVRTLRTGATTLDVAASGSPDR